MITQGSIGYLDEHRIQIIKVQKLFRILFACLVLVSFVIGLVQGSEGQRTNKGLNLGP